MPGTIRIFIGLALLILAGSLDDALPIGQFFLYAMALAIPGIIIALSGVAAASQSE